MPVVGPATLVAATYTFFFSFTSFALVKWLAPSSNTLESLLGEVGGGAGIAGYQVETSLAVLSIATFQMLIMLVMLIMAGRFERQHSQVLSMHHEMANREKHGSPSSGWTWFVNGTLVLLLAPLVAVVVASFRVRTQSASGPTTQWTLEGWRRAWNGDFSTLPFMDAVMNSLTYAGMTLIVALPLGYAVASCLVTLRQQGRKTAAGVLDSLCMLPLSMSAVMVGLGMVAGILRWFPQMFSFPYLPVVPHVMLVLPFVIRLMVPAIERIDPVYAEQASLLPLKPWASWWHARGAFLVMPATMAASLCLAFSLGEFGATFLVVRVGSWDSLSIMVDQVASRPEIRPLRVPDGHGAGHHVNDGDPSGVVHQRTSTSLEVYGMMFELRNGKVKLGDWTVFQDLNLKVEAGEIVSILGPSGCGKTTLLRACCGLEPLVNGSRHLDEKALPENVILPEITCCFSNPFSTPTSTSRRTLHWGLPGAPQRLKSTAKWRLS